MLQLQQYIRVIIRMKICSIGRCELTHNYWIIFWICEPNSGVIRTLSILCSVCQVRKSAFSLMAKQYVN